MSKPIYSLILEDNSTFVGGINYSETKWNDIPSDKKIKRIFYRLPKGDVICLSGYNKYCHLVEVTKDVYCSKESGLKLEYAYIMGQKDNLVRCYKINLQNNEIIICKDYDINDEFVTRIAIHCWK